MENIEEAKNEHLSTQWAKTHSEVLVTRLDKEISIRWILQDPKTGVIYMGDQNEQRILSVFEGKI